MKIFGGSETLTSKERVLRTFHHVEPDRVPINYSANPGIDARLRQYFGVSPDDRYGLLTALGVDFRGIHAPYIGPNLHEDRPDRKVNPLWGWITRYVEHESGGYWDYCDFPLLDADEETAANWPMPNPDDFDFSHIVDDCQRNQNYATWIGGPGWACIMNTLGFLRGMEQTFVDLATAEAAGLLIIDRMLAIHLEITRRMLEAAKGGIEFLWIGEDLGTQKGPIISPKLFREQILPRHKPFFDLAHAYQLPVMMHTCGSSSWAYEDYIKLGLTAVDTLQPEAAQMEPQYLKQTFGGRLAFHGCISTAGPVAYGTVEDVKQNCRETLELLMPGGGYCFAPTHSLQDNSPTENVIAMYETAHIVGQYKHNI